MDEAWTGRSLLDGLRCNLKSDNASVDTKWKLMTAHRAGPVIPAKAGIQKVGEVPQPMDSLPRTEKLRG